MAKALHDLTVNNDRRLLLVDERLTGKDQGTIIWEQRYELHRQSGSAAPMFGGVVLAGADSEVHVEPGTLRRASSFFSFPGIDGVFERHLGVRERPIKWCGQLRANDDSALDGIESAIEAQLRQGRAGIMVDSWNRAHEQCVLRAFVRCGRRRRDELTGAALQDFEIEFIQLGQ